MRKIMRVFALFLLSMICFCFFLGCKNLGQKKINSYQIYSIEEVYNAGDITFEDLLNLAYYSGNEIYNLDKFQGFTPKDKVEMDEETMMSLKAKLVEMYNERVSKEQYKATINDFEITYYGCFNGYYAFESRHINEEAPTEIIEEWEEIGGIRFRYTSNSRIKLWGRVYDYNKDERTITLIIEIA